MWIRLTRALELKVRCSRRKCLLLPTLLTLVARAGTLHAPPRSAASLRPAIPRRRAAEACLPAAAVIHLRGCLASLASTRGRLASRATTRLSSSLREQSKSYRLSSRAIVAECVHLRCRTLSCPTMVTLEATRLRWHPFSSREAETATRSPSLAATSTMEMQHNPTNGSSGQGCV